MTVDAVPVAQLSVNEVFVPVAVALLLELPSAKGTSECGIRLNETDHATCSRVQRDLTISNLNCVLTELPNNCMAAEPVTAEGDLIYVRADKERRIELRIVYDDWTVELAVDNNSRIVGGRQVGNCGS